MRWTVPVCLVVGALPIAGAVFVACTEESPADPSEGTDDAAAAVKACSAVTVPPMTDPFTGITCHPSQCTPDFCARGDIAPLQRTGATRPLLERLATLDCSPHSIPPLQVFAEANPNTRKSQLFMYYLLDNTTFQPSVFTTSIKGLNDLAMRTVWGANCDLPTIGAVRLELEPKPGLPTDPDDVRAFIDIFTDIRGLFVINNESGWYEGWMIHDMVVPNTASPDAKGHAKVNTITPDDAKLLAAMGHGNNVPGHVFTIDGEAPHLPSPKDVFPDKVSNVVPLQLSMGAYNSLQQSDAHNYWEFNYTTNWIHPAYELPFTGGTDNQYQEGQIFLRNSVVPGNTPASNNRSPSLAVKFGDNPNLPRDPDKFDATEEAEDNPNADEQREFRMRFVPSGVANEAFLNAFERLASFEPGVKDLNQRLIDGYKAAVALADTNGDGIISAVEGDVDTENPNCPQGDNTCLFLPPRAYNRFAVTREINDGILAPRFAPSTRGWVLAGTQVTGFSPVRASQGEDADDR
jgi:hypothetical protein